MFANMIGNGTMRGNWWNATEDPWEHSKAFKILRHSTDSWTLTHQADEDSQTDAPKRYGELTLQSLQKHLKDTRIKSAHSTHILTHSPDWLAYPVSLNPLKLKTAVKTSNAFTFHGDFRKPILLPGQTPLSRDTEHNLALVWIDPHLEPGAETGESGRKNNLDAKQVLGSEAWWEEEGFGKIRVRLDIAWWVFTVAAVKEELHRQGRLYSRWAIGKETELDSTETNMLGCLSPR